jgi:hypothetical protein
MDVRSDQDATGDIFAKASEGGALGCQLLQMTEVQYLIAQASLRPSNGKRKANTE